jgi:hypothetical protein
MKKYSAFLLNFIIIVGLLLSSCNILQTQEAQPNTTTSTNSTMKQAEVVFKVWIPEGTQAEATVNLDIVDEITGLAIYPQRYAMSQSSGYLYEVHIPVNIGSLVTYRYTKVSGTAVGEHTSTGAAVRYRILKVDGPTIVEDIIYAWGDTPLSKPTGRIQGRIIDETSNQPVANIMVNAGGISALTSSEGDYILEGLPTGTHNLVAYSIDGKYTVYQQGAMVAQDATTPANLKLRPADQVTVTFITNTPADASAGLPIAIVGNMLQLGDTFADLTAGFSTLQNRTAMMTVREDGSYSYSIQLPAGFDLRYKYTLGDGFWNAEHNTDGGFRLRQLIVPNGDVVINDTIDTWGLNSTTPFVFRLTVPEGTPLTDTISIQFNPFDWTPPLTMWSLGNRQYIYVLYSPYQLLGDITYRYCRNDQCEKSIGILNGKTAEQMMINQSSASKDITDEITQWTNYQSLPETPTVVVDIVGRIAGFVSGFELSNQYSPINQSHYIDAISSIYQSKANMLMLTPTWSITHNSPPIIESLPGKDMYRSDLDQIAGWVNETGMSLAIFPQFNTGNLVMDDWWMNAERSDGWWQSWYDRYHTFIMNYALQGTSLQADALVLNDGNINPALPSGLLPDGTPSGVPGNSLDRWKQLISDVRAVYGGEIYWAVYEDTDISTITEILSLVDKVIYVGMDASLPSAENPAEIVATYFSEHIHPIYEQTSKPIIIGITFNQEITPDKQYALYKTILEQINQENWISGVISQEFNPTVRLQDNSNSVFGKSTMEILSYWYPYLVSQ